MLGVQLIGRRDLVGVAEATQISGALYAAHAAAAHVGGAPDALAVEVDAADTRRGETWVSKGEDMAVHQGHREFDRRSGCPGAAP